MKSLILSLTLILSLNVDVKAQYTLQRQFPQIGNFFVAMEMTNAGDGTNRKFLAERRGMISTFKNDSDFKKTFVDAAPLLEGSSANELLGIAFHPDYENNRHLFLSYCIDSVGWRIKIIRLTTSLANPDSVSLATRVDVLSYLEPHNLHNGGTLRFGNDGMLYYSFGDGNSFLLADDPTNLSGKIIRIDVRTLPYTIPADNPFATHPTFRKEIWAYGTRNVWKFSFDKPTGKLWAGDVGESSFEEVNIIESGKNYGWAKMEGNICVGFVCDTAGRNVTPPLFAYPHNGSGKSITGGYVYRGHSDSALYGKYIYADFVTRQIFSLSQDGLTNTLLVTSPDLKFTTFGETENRELYVVNMFGGIYSFYTHYAQGDVNKDGSVNLADMILVYNSNINFESGNVQTDLNFDGFVTLVDLLIIYNLII